MAASRGFDFPYFREKVVIITGASSDIGTATAREFAKDGAKLAINGRNPHRLEKVVGECVNLGIPRENIFSNSGDLTEIDQIRLFVEETVGKLGGVDVLVNNAGYIHETVPNEMDSFMLEEMLEVHVKTAWNMIKFCRQYLQKRGGSVINVTSYFASSTPGPDCVEYAIAKGAMKMLTKNLVQELSTTGIRINDVAPGVIKPSSQAPDGTPSDTTQHSHKDDVLGDAGQPEHVAHVIQFLASPAAAYVTGAEILVDGGITNGAAK